MLVIAFITSPDDSVFAQQSRKPLKKDQILELLNSFVPSARIAEPVAIDGINFEPDTDYLRKVESAGAKKALADAPRAKGCDSKVQEFVDRGNATLDGGNYLEAEKAFNSALSLQPDCFDAHVGLADLLMHEKEDADNGLKHAKEALGLNPADARARNIYGDALLHAGSTDEGIAELRKAISHDAGNFEARLNLGWALMAMKRQVETGPAEIREALRLSPGHSHAHLVLGEVFDQKGDLDGAISQVRGAISMKPERYQFEARRYLGVLLRRKGDIEGAIATLSDLLRLRPEMASAHNELGTAFEQKGDLTQAMAAFREAIRLKPGDGMSHYNLGKILEKKGDLAGALKEYRVAYQYAPDNAQIRGDYERLLKQP